MKSLPVFDIAQKRYNSYQSGLKKEIPVSMNFVFEAFSILVFTETGRPSGFFLKKKPTCTISKGQHVNRKCSRTAIAVLMATVAFGQAPSSPPPSYRFESGGAAVKI